MKVRLMASGGAYEVEQLGVFSPKPVPKDALSAGEEHEMRKFLQDLGYIE